MHEQLCEMEEGAAADEDGTGLINEKDSGNY